MTFLNFTAELIGIAKHLWSKFNPERPAMAEEDQHQMVFEIVKLATSSASKEVFGLYEPGWEDWVLRLRVEGLGFN